MAVLSSKFTVLLSLCTILWSVGSLALAAPSSDLEQKLSSDDRSEADRARDVGRKPAEVVRFLEIEPGMTVLDLIAASGYYSEVLSIAVGPEGKVYAQNNEYVLKVRDGANDKAMTGRLANDRLPNVVRLDRELAELGLEPGSLDAAFTALNFHDIYNARGKEAALSFLRTVYGLLEPGGVLGIVDHDGDPEKANAELHRIPEVQVREVAKEAGFTLEDSGTMLRNPKDDRSGGVFGPELRGRTDRFVLLLRKPGGVASPQ